MSEPVLGLRDVAVERPGRRIVDVPSLDVLPGEILAIIGPNGAGKSTLLQVMALLERPARGKVLFEGEPVSGDLLRHRRRMAVVFQEPLLLDTSVESNVRAGLALRGVPHPERQRRVADWLGRFGIAHLARRSARTLSGGEAQRTSLARALVLEPQVLLLDEPFAALDAPAREALIDDLDRLLEGSPIGTVLVTHDRSEALRLGDRLAVMMDGTIRQTGTPSEVFSSPVDEEVASFVGVETIIPGRVCSTEGGLATVTVGGHTVEAAAPRLAAGTNVLVCLRPEDVVLGPPDEPAAHTSARNRLEARVNRMTLAGPLTRVELDAGFAVVALITRQSQEELALAPGGRVVASFKAAAVHLIPRHQHPSQETGG